MYSFIKPYDKTIRKYLYILRCTYIIRGLFLLIPSLSIKILFDNLIPSKNINKIVVWIIVFIILSILINAYMFYFVDYLGDKSATIISNDIRKKLLKKMLSVSMITYSKLDQDSLYNIIIQDTTIAIVSFINDKVCYIVALIQYIFYLIILFYIEWKIGVILAIISPLFFIITWKNEKKFYLASKDERNQADNLIKHFYLILNCKKQAYLYNKNTYFYNFFKSALTTWEKSKIHYSLFFNLLNRIPNFLKELVSFIIIGICSINVIHNKISLGTLILINQIISYAFEQLTIMVTSKVQVSSTKHIFERINKLLFIDEINNNLQPSNHTIINFYDVDINIKKNFLYHINNFCISENGIFLLRGQNGCGKTFLFNIITNLVKTNFKNTNHIQIPSLDCIGYFCTPNFFINDTILNNITFNENKDPHVIEEITTMLQIKNLDHIINTSNLTLSLGQQQKINLARFFINNINKDIWLLDEPLVNLDITTTKQIVNFLEKHSKVKKILIVSHDEIFEEKAKIIFKIEDNQLKTCENKLNLLREENYQV